MKEKLQGARRSALKSANRLLSLLLAVVMVVAMLPAIEFPAAAATEGWIAIGSCEWQLTGEENAKTLTIRPLDNGNSGTLPNDAKNANDWPWVSYGKEIKKVVIKEGVTAGNSTSYMFSGCRNLTSIEGLSGLNTEKVTDMSYMFSGCSSLTSLDLSGFKTSKVENMTAMFSECKLLENVDLSTFDTSSVVNLCSIFRWCTKIGAARRVELIKSLLKTNNDLCTDWAASLFCGCTDTTMDLSTLPSTANVTDMSYMFSYCSSLTELDLSSLNTGNVEFMYYMFSSCSSLKKLDLSTVETAKVTNMSTMFYKCSALEELDLSNFNTENVAYMNSMFQGCSSLTELDLSSFNTENVLNMTNMFNSCSSLTELDLSSFDTKSVRKMYHMFSKNSLTVGAPDMQLETILVGDKWTTENALDDCKGMFYGCTSLEGGAGTKYDSSKYTGDQPYKSSDVAFAQIDGENSKSGYLTRGYRVTVNSAITNGKVTLGGKATVKGYAKGDTVTVTVAPAEGYELAGLTYKAEGDAQATKITATEGIYSFEMPEKDVTVTAEFTQEHSFTYSLSDDNTTITATCGNGLCSLTDNKVSLTLSAEDKDYTGKAYEGASISDTTAWTAAGLTAPTIKYAGRGDTTYEESETAPTNVGTYTAKITAGEKTASVDFTINRADIATATFGAISPYNYTSKEITPKPVVTFNGETLEEGKDYELSYENNVEPGTEASVTVAGKGNFTGSQKLTFTIIPPCRVTVNTENKTVQLMDTVTVTADVTGMPENCKLVWVITGSSKWSPVSISEDGKTITIVARSYGNLKISARVVDAEGKTVQNADDTEGSDSTTVDVMLQFSHILQKLMKVLNSFKLFFNK